MKTQKHPLHNEIAWLKKNWPYLEISNNIPDGYLVITICNKKGSSQGVIFTQNQIKECIDYVKSKTKIIKVCPDPGCEAVYHNCPTKQTHCIDCGGWIKKINEETYWKKFADKFFQYDFLTGQYYRPKNELNHTNKT